MYGFLDRPVCDLAPGTRLMLWAARGWSHARAAGACPPGSIAPAFIHCGTAAALPHVHRLLSLLEGEEPGALDLPKLDHDRVEDMEAVLVQLWADAVHRPTRARATIELMLRDQGEEADGDKTGAAFEALACATAILSQRGLAPVGMARARGADA